MTGPNHYTPAPGKLTGETGGTLCLRSPFRLTLPTPGGALGSLVVHFGMAKDENLAGRCDNKAMGQNAGATGISDMSEDTKILTL